MIACNFGEKFVGADSDTGGKASLSDDERFDVSAECRGHLGCERFKVMTEVEIRFVHLDLFDLATEAGDDFHDRTGFGLVGIHARGEEYPLGAESMSGPGGHG